jgi:hypothetical protein
MMVGLNKAATWNLLLLLSNNTLISHHRYMKRGAREVNSDIAEARPLLHCDILQDKLSQVLDDSLSRRCPAELWPNEEYILN